MLEENKYGIMAKPSDANIEMECVSNSVEFVKYSDDVDYEKIVKDPDLKALDDALENTRLIKDWGMEWVHFFENKLLNYLIVLSDDPNVDTNILKNNTELCKDSINKCRDSILQCFISCESSAGDIENHMNDCLINSDVLPVIDEYIEKDNELRSSIETLKMDLFPVVKKYTELNVNNFDFIKDKIGKTSLNADTPSIKI